MTPVSSWLKGIAIWLAIIAATLMSWRISDGQNLKWDGTAVILIALVKIRLIARTYMEIDHAPFILKILLDTWLVAIGGILLKLYWH